VSGAVAHANALSGVVNAFLDGAPMLLVTGITPLADLGWGNFQDFNPVPMTAPVCKYARLVDVPERVPQLVHEAFAAATAGRPGPVHLALPLDVAAAEVDPAQVIRSPVRSGEVRLSGAGAPELAEEAAALLGQAGRPLLVAGSGVYYSRGEQPLAALARQQQLPIVVPIWDRGSIPEPLDTFLGVLGAASGGPRLLADADLILLAGAELDYRVGQVRPPAVRADARVIRIHADAGRLWPPGPFIRTGPCCCSPVTAPSPSPWRSWSAPPGRG
jgi:acetolactate synthase-1/2/3 large subunit